MSTLDQCPTSAKEGKPVEKDRVSHTKVGAGTGQAYWRSLDDLADTPQFREFLEREFPSGASELLDSSRRSFLKVMGAGLALAGAATIPACRRPEHKILPYSRNVPEEIIPGKSLFYATSLPLPGGGAEGILVETHEGRPTKIEGNPLHPVNLGKSSTWSQACVLDLYDPDRLKEPQIGASGKYQSATWDDWAAWSKKHFAKFWASKGKGLAIIIDKGGGPTTSAMLAEVKAKMPEATVIAYDALENASAAAGTAIAFGSPMRDRLMLEKAKLIVSIDRDFLQYEAGSLANCRGFASMRRPLGTKKAGEKLNDEMTRLYCVEAFFSTTGAASDHRLVLAPSQIPAFVVVLAKALASRLPASVKAAVDALPTPDLGKEASVYAEHIAKDLAADFSRGASVIVCGASQPPAVHALVAALNDGLKAIGTTIGYYAETATTSAGEQLASLVAKMKAGEIDTLVTLGCNPVFTAPADLEFAKAFEKVANRITLSTDHNETIAASTWRLNSTHTLEAWGDTEAIDGTIAPIQPMIAPLYRAQSAIEVLAAVTGRERADGYEIVRETWKKIAGATDFEKAWRQSLWNGVIQSSGRKPADVKLAASNVATAVAGLKFGAAPTSTALDVQWVVGVNHDGRFANNGWLQEIPEPASHVVWDNPALVSPATASKLGLEPSSMTDTVIKGRMADLSVGGRTMQICVWSVPGIADDTVVLLTGMGRKAVGLVGQGCGFNVFEVRNSTAPWVASGGQMKPASTGDAKYPISSTQTHGSMEGRAIVRELDLAAWNAHGGEPAFTKKDPYGREQRMSLAEQLDGGELNHMPANVGSYVNPFNNSESNAAPGSKYTVSPQWGMTIDLSTCIGCNVCTVACQAENNIPVVGKVAVREYREMSWIRVDRYFTGADRNKPTGAVFQPLPCVQCENAPCEVVCPVNATVHGEEGHNYMTYNRCIGTRYCANNCPYKVRRFNWFDYGVTKYQGGYFGEETIEGALPMDAKGKPHKFDPNLVPPRLREKLDEITRLGKNPNVTIRSRGVMEKCTYCMQRTNEAKITFKLKNPGKRPEDGMPDGIVQTACQQACPTNAIVFGDILDTKTENTHPDGTKFNGSHVRFMREHNRSYMLLGYLNTRPRTTHMARVGNLNRDLLIALGQTERVKWLDDPFDPHSEHGSHGHGHDHGHEGEHGHDHEEKKGAFVDPARSGEQGYKLSLAVLGGAR